MYFVDRTLIEKRLQYMEVLMDTFQAQKTWATHLEKMALERIVHHWLEAMIDVGNQMIDGFIMRDPGGYSDIIDILEDENVIDMRAAQSLQTVLVWRKTLVHDYLNIDHDGLVATIRGHEQDMTFFPNAIRIFLENELGPVSAFLPDER